MTYRETLSRQLPGGTEEIERKETLGYMMPKQRFEPGTSRIQFNSVTTTADLLACTVLLHNKPIDYKRNPRVKLHVTELGFKLM
jgi:hypothetical protein